jgi:aminoglycoside 6'-N-acetyltransferase
VPVRLIDMTGEDLPLVEKWLRAGHVRRFWGEPEKSFGLLRDPPANTTRALIEADGRKVGLVLWQHPARAELDAAGLGDIPASVIDIDIMIGERDATGKGVGAAAIRLAAERALTDPAVPFVMAGTEVQNEASLRAFAAAGFHREREFDDAEGGRFVLMIRHRSSTNE